MAWFKAEMTKILQTLESAPKLLSQSVRQVS